MKDRAKLDTIELIEALTLTLDKADFITKDGEEFAVVTFKEFPTGFYFGGKVLTDIINMIYDELKADREKPVDLAEYDIGLVAERKKSKTGRMYTAFVIK